MDKFLILDYGSRKLNDSEFNVLNVLMNYHFGFPNNTGTERYADPIVHPDGVLVAMKIIPESEVCLSDAQKTNLIDKLPSDWNI